MLHNLKVVSGIKPLRKVILRF